MDDDKEQDEMKIIDATLSDSDSMFIAIDRREVEACDISTTLAELKLLLNKKYIRKYKHMVTITFSGYDYDPREVFEIPEIRQFMLALTQKFHFWFYFLNIDNGTLVTIAGCLYGAKQIGNGQMQFNNPQDLLDFYEYQLDASQYLAKQAHFTEEETRDLEREINSYYLGTPMSPVEKEECEKALEICRVGKPSEETVKVLNKYKKDDTECLAFLSDCYYYGYGVKKDYEKAVQYTLKAKDNGSFTGMIYYGEWRERLRSVFNDADRGDSEAEYKLGISYWYGCGVEQDKEEAIKWMKKAVSGTCNKDEKAVIFLMAHILEY